MSKMNCQTTQITTKALLILGPYEFKVFMAWFIDKEGYDATQQQLAAKTGINVDSISKILKKLVEKKVLILTGKKYVHKVNNFINIYSLGPSILSTEEVKEPELTTKEDINHLDNEDDFDKQMDLMMKGVING